MYKCEAFKCKKNGGTPLTPMSQPCNTIIVEKRAKTYQRVVKKGKRRGFVEEIEGWEIAKEIKVCAVCYERITGLKAAKTRSSLMSLMQRKEKKPLTKKKKRFKKEQKPGNNNYRKRKPKDDRKTSR
tara:strand:- start:1293 stop:1673 length:381 start_codon:yes stop_codon:yes gene_type:complete